MQNKKVIYTAIFGGKDILHESLFLPKGFDFVCFTDNKDLRSTHWNIRVVSPFLKDPVRNARYYKIMAHQVLPEYEQSVWIDGNMIVKGNVDVWVKKYLSFSHFATFDHSKQKRRIFKFFWIQDKALARDCIYDELQQLVTRTEKGMYMDDIETMKKQVAKYQEEGYPKHNGLAVTMIMLRNHHDKKVIELMEAWWREIEHGSRRDQLSLNYVAWKQNYPITYISGDPRYNPFFLKTRHHIKTNFK
jgi:hypothetical protein